jgi:protein required for attachment to host cells
MKIAHGTLVMAIDGSKMLLFRNDGDEKYVVLDTLSHDQIEDPASHDIGSDAPGRSFASEGNRRSAYSETNWHDQAEERFAIAGAHRLESVLQSEKGDVVVLAAPRTLGQLRKHWGRETKARLIGEIAKDMVHHEWDDIARAIADHHPARDG